ncbi:replication protein A 14 kDa subunit-like [Neodiprion fabricii]|uniref:replication protein A 14 kDa subunit-like n=1 Tax=Neodiprion fabricii TaxID=2872261 RepID=UPI001ED94BD0|nr:replication protein A 14 kDa subunit-like [Neodiprion fabricii]
MIKKRINGQLVSQHIGDQIILLGSINKINPSGTSMELKTSDNMIITVSLSEPIDSHLEGYIEVHGTVQSKSSISCSNFVRFPNEMTEKFDLEQYNDLILLSNTLGSNKWKMSETNTIL